MNEIEIIICLLLLFMGVPDLCRWLKRPALVYPVFVVFGLLIAPLVDGPVKTMLVQAGQVGFLLLLFEVGMEIELPRFREFRGPLAKAFGWALLQYPVIFALGWLAGLNWIGCLIACAAFTGCSVGMGHPGWKQYPGLDFQERRKILMMMIALEIFAIVLLSVETTFYERAPTWEVALKLGGIVLVLVLISMFARRIKLILEHLLKQAMHWRVHLIVLFVLLVCAVGERLGLSAIKTAFFLGLFLSRIEHEGQSLEAYIAPVSQRFLIPIFFFALGLQIPAEYLVSWAGLIALGSATLILAMRWAIQRWILPVGGKRGERMNAFLLLCPNLTITALAAGVLVQDPTTVRAASLVLLVGLFMTVPSILLLPAPPAAKEPAPSDAPDAH
ncbi:Kef-type K+ transport system membrane component KefB [Ereboglobus sp. PH5-5]|uniref:cation:proton antiporter n=1 Tax=unclassified Ereboglobus TaxID=2626932 RepID=UPI002407722B|nr:MULTISPECIES: cation:proton antiporter [unclassified Ereboglobus]MDF9827976.1 Kef-type K+ transport system membrane component KefB [Ereboglobus sp. PH5-10]MDF9832380.1 Kef-type K+ transport system membrane component KefB [Ereboglobus sp. PH5-5]